MKDTFFSVNNTLNCRGNLCDISQPKVMTILNATSDSFYEKSQIAPQKAEHKILEIIDLQPDIIDIGGQSTRPGASIISEQEELNRVLPIVEIVNNFFDGPISIDTFRSNVAAKAIEAGATIINDVSGGNMEPEIYDVAAETSTPYILMHMRGTPKTMQNLTSYDNLNNEIKKSLSEKINLLHKKGVNDIIIDPGFGFAKSPQQNLNIIKNLNFYRSLAKPILMGVSRKSTIQKIIKKEASESLNGTTVLHTLCLENGANILRVHDTLEAQQCIQLWKAYNEA